jgi:hypothetical protein
VAAGLADTLATIAAVLDRETGGQSLADRLDQFCGRVQATYHRLRHRNEGGA